jgi:hypothetical protein
MAQPGVIYSSNPHVPTCAQHQTLLLVLLNNLLFDLVTLIPDFQLVFSLTQAKGVNSGNLKDVDCNGLH